LLVLIVIIRKIVMICKFRMFTIYDLDGFELV
jgi:hypothetical protein